MKKFIVTIEDTVHTYTDVEVEAETTEEAEKIAMEKFNRGDTDCARVDWDSSDNAEVSNVEEA
jgi:hypothetical protein